MSRGSSVVATIARTVARCSPYLLTLLSVTSLIAMPSFAEGKNWPHEISVPEAEIVIYQPQLESFSGDKLSSRAAISVTVKDATDPVFGAAWFDCRVDTDREARTVDLLDVKVSAIKFPDAAEEHLEKLTAILEREIPTQELTIDLDQLLAALDLVERERAAAEDLDTAPPEIIFATGPAVLVVIDGEPELRAIEETDLMRVINTPFLTLLDSPTKSYFLRGGDLWFRAAEIKGDWSLESDPPQSVTAYAARLDEEAAAFDGTGEAGDTEPPADAASAQDQIPQVFVRTTPAELIQTDGKPTYSPISGADLLYMSNTETDVFLTIGTQQFYALLSGRWYTSKNMTGTWTYVPSGELPEAFAAISPDSERGHVLANIAGTQEAREAVLDAQIPQTATVDRNEATCTVEYDGEPQFEAIEKTDMKYAINTASSVIRIGGSYYCCEDAVWFAASDPLGPWSVCVSVPSEVQTIPPSCPIYNVKYVYVYDYTPSVVYVGYTPGYAGCYVYGGTIVYGTGYIYRGWYGPVYYYPRPVTYGFSMRYSPYYGWGFGFHAGVSGPHGWFHMSWRSGGWHRPPGYRPPHGGWWGAGGYRPTHTNVNVNVNRNISRNVNVNRNIYADRRAGVRDTRTRQATPRTREGAARPQQQPRAATPRVSDRPNNVIADRNGNVHRKTDQGWQTRDRSGWSSDRSSRPSSGPATMDRTRQLDRQQAARDRGAQRSSNYQRSQQQRSQPQRQPQRQPSGSRSGGGRRR